MNRALFLSLTVAVSALGLSSRAHAEDNAFSAFLSYKHVGGLNYKFSHDTHPNDPFLPNSTVPGSAGETSLNQAHFAVLGLGWSPRIYEGLHLTVDAGMLLGGSRSRHQNDNDPRPAAQGAFVYSEAGPIGAHLATGLEYRWKRIAFGVEAQYAGFPVSSGWDRFSSDEAVRTEFRSVVSAGPKFGLAFTEKIRLEGSVQFGHSTGAFVGLRFNF